MICALEQKIEERVKQPELKPEILRQYFKGGGMAASPPS
jgi:hypothetical protein